MTPACAIVTGPCLVVLTINGEASHRVHCEAGGAYLALMPSRAIHELADTVPQRWRPQRPGEGP